MDNPLKDLFKHLLISGRFFNVNGGRHSHKGKEKEKRVLVK